MANNIIEILLRAKDEISQVIGGVIGKVDEFAESTKKLEKESSLAFDEALYNFEQYGIAMGDSSAEYSGAIDEVTGELKKFGDKTDEVEEQSSGAWNEMLANFNNAVTGINQGIELAIKVFNTLKKAYDETVGKTLEIAGEVEELARISGDAPEALSALRLEADSVGVSMDNLKTAMENMANNGVPPTIDSLLDLAKEYVNLEDPIARAELLTDNFGKAGYDIAPMLEAIADGIDEVQNTGLIFTEEDIQAVKDYEVAVADLGEAWDSLTVKIGKIFIPSLTEFFTRLAGNPTELAILYDEVASAAALALDKKRITLEEYNSLIHEIKINTGSYSGYVSKLNFILGYLDNTNGEVAGSTEELGAEMALTSGAYDVYAGAVSISREELDAMRAAAQETQEQIADLQEALADANLNLDIAIRTFSESIGSNLAQGLRDAGLEGDELLERLGLIDQAFGTSYVLEYQMELNVDDLLDTLINDPDNFLPDAQQFLDYFTPLQESVINAMTQVDELEAQLEDIERTWNVRVNITTTGSLPDFPTPGFNPVENFPQAAGGAVRAAATGIAAGMTPYWVGELGPEPFFPATNGRIVSNTQAMMALRGGAGIKADEIADAVKQGLIDALRDRRAGIGNTYEYNLTMPTSSNPADVRTAFELMEAWA
jgi:uncharacterized protein YjbJ (UPF0337 family)